MAPRIARLKGGTSTITLHHRGRRNRGSGDVRDTDLQFLADGDNLVVAAARGGSDIHPSWFLNLQTTPEAEVSVGRKRRGVTARVAEGDERAALWPRLAEVIPDLEEFQSRTERVIPVVVLEPRA